MAKPIRRRVAVTEPTKVSAEKVGASSSRSSAKYRPRAIPNKFKESGPGRVFVWISYPFAFVLLWSAMTKDQPADIRDLQTFKHLCLTVPFCAVALFGIKSYRRGAIVSLVCSLLGFTAFFF